MPTLRPALLGDMGRVEFNDLLPQLGLCGRGEDMDFLRSGQIDRGASLPINTNGGQLGEAFIHRMNGIAEAVRQIRGTARNQIEGVDHALSGSMLSPPQPRALNRVSAWRTTHRPSTAWSD